MCAVARNPAVPVRDKTRAPPLTGRTADTVRATDLNKDYTTHLYARYKEKEEEAERLRLLAATTKWIEAMPSVRYSPLTGIV